MSWFTIKNYIQKFEVSDSTIRRKIRTKQIPSKRIGAKIFVWADDSTNRGTEGTSQTEEQQFDISRDGQRIEMLSSVNSQRHQSSLPKELGSSIAELIAFSSKALNSYLMISDKLISEKDKRINERETHISDQKQRIAELESYIKALEGKND